MGNVVINVGEVDCQDPIFTSVTYTGTRYEFKLNWTSQGAYFYQFDNTMTMYLYIECYLPGNATPYFNQQVPTPPSIPFDAINYTVNVLDYDSTFTSKNRLVFRLVMAGETTCYTETTYEFPPDTIN